MTIWLPALLLTCFLNLRLYCPSPLSTSLGQTPPDLPRQLKGNRKALESGAPARMQTLFPEGYFFCYVFHGLTWVELARRDPAHTQQAIQEAAWCLEKLESSAGRAPFPSRLPPDHGMFYSAWKASLHAGIVMLEKAENPERVQRLRENCDAIAAALQNASTPFLPSYQGAAWPCDSMPAIHAMAACDILLNEDRYAEVINTWLEKAKDRIDPETGLLPHTASLPNGRNNGIARATSQVIILRYMADVDADFAREQYTIFRDRFLTTFMGIPSVLEYPSGMSGRGDIDSGPLVFGRSVVSTVAMMGIAQIFGDDDVANTIAQAGETVGLPWTSNGQKRYVCGILPVGEIIVAWTHVATPWFSQDHFPETIHPVSSFWRLPVHGASTLVLLPLFLRRQKRQSTQNTSSRGHGP